MHSDRSHPASCGDGAGPCDLASEQTTWRETVLTNTEKPSATLQGPRRPARLGLWVSSLYSTAPTISLSKPPQCGHSTTRSSRPGSTRTLSVSQIRRLRALKSLPQELRDIWFHPHQTCWPNLRVLLLSHPPHHWVFVTVTRPSSSCPLQPSLGLTTHFHFASLHVPIVANQDLAPVSRAL